MYSDFRCAYKFAVVFVEESEYISIEIYPKEKELWHISAMDNESTVSYFLK